MLLSQFHVGGVFSFYFAATGQRRAQVIGRVATAGWLVVLALAPPLGQFPSTQAAASPAWHRILRRRPAVAVVSDRRDGGGRPHARHLRRDRRRIAQRVDPCAALRDRGAAPCPQGVGPRSGPHPDGGGAALRWASSLQPQRRAGDRVLGAHRSDHDGEPRVVCVLHPDRDSRPSGGHRRDTIMPCDGGTPWRTLRGRRSQGPHGWLPRYGSVVPRSSNG